MRQCRQNPKLIAVGGKARKNNLKVLDLEVQKEIFSSKNVPHDSLQLEVPVWDSDLAFVNGSDHCLATCSRHGYIRFYDSRQQRRPVLNYVDSRELAFNSLAERAGTVFVGTTTGGLFAFDLRSLKVALHTYKGAVGAITSVAIDDTGRHVVSASLDRYVRVHLADKTELVYQAYVKSKASQVLVKKADARLLSELQKDKQLKVAESDEEFENLFDKMQTVQDEPAAKKQKKSLKTSKMKRHSGIVYRKSQEEA